MLRINYAFLCFTCNFIATLCKVVFGLLISIVLLHNSHVSAILSSPTLVSRLLFAQTCMLFYYVKNYWTVILSYVDNVGCLPFLRNFTQLKILSQIMKILEIPTVFIDCVPDIFVSQCITDGWFFRNSF